MVDRKLGVLIHGAGWVSTQHAAAFRNNPKVEVVAVSSRRLTSAQRLAAEYAPDAACYDDYEAALRHDGVDIVSICTPQHVHLGNIVAAAEAGKHLAIEKPVVNSLEEMRQARDAVREAGVKTVVSFVLRWNPLFETLKSMLADNAFGQVYHVEADYLSYIAGWWSGYADSREPETGVCASLLGGCHAIDAVRWFAAGGSQQAAKPVEVFAYRGGVRKGRSETYDYHSHTWSEGLPLEYDGLEIALIRFDNGVTGKVTTNFESIQPYEFPLRIFGDRGTVRDNRFWSHKFPGQTDWIEIPTICPDSSDVTHHPFQGELDHFVDCILTDRESHCNLEDAVSSHEIVYACLQCYETGQPVSLPLL